MNTPNASDLSSDQNLDPLSGEPGSHPVATGIGSAAIGAAGLIAAAAVAGPVGIAAAAVGGALIGGYVGKAAGELIDPTAEEAFWRENHRHQPYAQMPYDYFSEAYRAGYMGAASQAPETANFDLVETDLQIQYERSGATLPWATAREAARAAWQRAQDRVAVARSRRADDEVA